MSPVVKRAVGTSSAPPPVVLPPVATSSNPATKSTSHSVASTPSSSSIPHTTSSSIHISVGSSNLSSLTSSPRTTIGLSSVAVNGSAFITSTISASQLTNSTDEDSTGPFAAVGGPAGLTGLVVAVFSIILFAGMLVFYLCLRRRRRNNIKESDPRKVSPWRAQASTTTSMTTHDHHDSSSTHSWAWEHPGSKRSSIMSKKGFPGNPVMDARQLSNHSISSHVQPTSAPRSPQMRSPQIRQQKLNESQSPKVPHYLTLPYSPPDSMNGFIRGEEELNITPEYKVNPAPAIGSCHLCNHCNDQPASSKPNSVSAAAPPSSRTTFDHFSPPKRRKQSQHKKNYSNGPQPRRSSRQVMPYAPKTIMEMSESELEDDDIVMEIDITDSEPTPRTPKFRYRSKFDGDSRSPYDGDSDLDPERSPTKKDPGTPRSRFHELLEDDLL